VSFAWRDYKDGNKSKVMKLDATEFCRRFLLHVLPNRFVKIRHYGLLCSRNIKSKLSQCMKMTGTKPLSQTNKIRKDDKVCRCCGSTDVITLLIPNSLAMASSACMIAVELNSYLKLPNLGRGEVCPFPGV
jgi:hypothetical protein